MTRASQTPHDVANGDMPESSEPAHHLDGLEFWRPAAVRRCAAGPPNPGPGPPAWGSTALAELVGRDARAGRQGIHLGIITRRAGAGRIPAERLKPKVVRFGPAAVLATLAASEPASSVIVDE